MLYHKYKGSDRQTVVNELFEDEIITYCGDCSKEIEIFLDDICHINMEGGDFAGTTFFCTDCSQKRVDAP